MIWHVFHRPAKLDAPSTKLGLVHASTKDDAHHTAGMAWPGKTFDIISAESWATMDKKQRLRYEGKPVGDESFRQISPDVRSSKCETCAGEIFYRKHRSNQWRKPPTHCPTCKPSPAVSAPRVHAAYLPEPTNARP